MSDDYIFEKWPNSINNIEIFFVKFLKRIKSLFAEFGQKTLYK